MASNVSLLQVSETNLPAQSYSIRLHEIQKHTPKLIKESERLQSY
jgi:hypothetical protein